jgi:endoglucanase
VGQVRGAVARATASTLCLLLGVLLAACGTGTPSAQGSPGGTASTATASSPGSTGSAISPGSTGSSTPTGSGDPSAPAPVGRSANPFVGAPPYVWPDESAAQAVGTVSGGDARLIGRIAATPTAIWLTPEQYTVGQVGAFVRSVMAGAGARTPVFVLYGITDRDCVSGQSSGGLPPQRYLAWVRNVARSLTARSAVILEPDALASSPQCGNTATREHLLRRAIDMLGTGPTVYLDAGHANWIPAGQMAQMLQASGIDQIRGFSLNVSSYDATSAEEQYADALRTLLPQAHYVIDTGRNGNGGQGGNGEFCNAPNQALGHVPAVGAAPGLDAYLWIKPPGESDGSCHGAPPAGQFWVQGAAALARAAGW